ncbi:hypothetical protein E2C01_048280 [Portunus trituberculatus]|uniref:Uncharacterized protein n=1 Tax=Portunus trituberculatus TaxID=210409 RepID=A0A5B7G9T0_PORTR|nr:hypothetical protein [Portunus trituberculatus]
MAGGGGEADAVISGSLVQVKLDGSSHQRAAAAAAAAVALVVVEVMEGEEQGTGWRDVGSEGERMGEGGRETVFSGVLSPHKEIPFRSSALMRS